MFAMPEKPPDIQTSYRSINLLPNVSKICDRLIILNAYSYIYSQTYIVTASQFGIGAKHGMIYQAHRVVNTICT